MPIYSRTTLKARLATRISGTISDTDLAIVINNAVTEVVSDIDLRSCIRRAALVPKLFDEIFQYSAPADLKGRKVIDIEPQVGRGRLDEWKMTTVEEFDRFKISNRLDQYGELLTMERSTWSGDSLVAVDDRDTVKRILLSRPTDDSSIIVDSFDSTGTWTAIGDTESITRDSSNYVTGSASLKFNIGDGGTTTAGIADSSHTSTDLTEYLSEGSFFVWAYITSTTNLTNFILRVGSSASAYYQITVTTTNESASFTNGWNLLRFDMANKATTGTPVYASCTYISLCMTKEEEKIDEVGYRFDGLTLRKGVYHYLRYYSKYGWQTSAGSYLENSTQDTDLLNADTDELRLIEYKAAELGETHLRSSAVTIKEKRDLYEEYANRYRAQYPSLALPMTITYHEMNYL